MTDERFLSKNRSPSSQNPGPANAFDKAMVRSRILSCRASCVRNLRISQEISMKVIDVKNVFLRFFILVTFLRF